MTRKECERILVVMHIATKALDEEELTPETLHFVSARVHLKAARDEMAKHIARLPPEVPSSRGRDFAIPAE